jgi:hypothetical protein
MWKRLEYTTFVENRLQTTSTGSCNAINADAIGYATSSFGKSASSVRPNTDLNLALSQSWRNGASAGISRAHEADTLFARRPQRFSWLTNR